ncbi:MAG: hypothetical protein Tsb0017_16510 [Geothermobacteraceae bacterium]
MKCPKCGYTSFDFLDNCKKCGQDLGGHKSKFGLRSVIFPQVAAAAAAEEATAPVETAAEEATDFGFDFMSDQEPGAAEVQEEAPEAGGNVPEPEGAEEDFDFSSDAEGMIDPSGGELAADAEASVDNEEVIDLGAEEDNGIGFDDETAGGFDFGTADEGAIDFGEDDDQELDFDNQPAEDAAEEDFDFSLDEEESQEETDEKETSDPFDQRGSAEVGRAPEADPLPLIDDFDRELPNEQGQLPEADDRDADVEAISYAETIDEPEVEPAPLPVEEGVWIAELEDLAQPEGSTIPPAVAPRLAAAAVDLAILAALLFLFLIAGEWMAPGPNASLLPTRGELLDLAIPYFIVFFALCFGYFTLFHFLTGQTPGKMLFRLQVEAEDGSPLTLSQAFLRSVGGLICLLTAGLGYLAILVRPSRRGWNDDLAGSRLVACREGDETAG